MRSLIVFRHGKSDWHADGGDDRTRPLAPRGRRSAAAMGRFLSGIGEVPEFAVSSPAVRASDTLRIAVEAGGWACELGTSDALYAGVGEVLADLRQLVPEVLIAMVVGHEPTFSALTATLIGGGRVRLPTAGMARIDLDVESWADLQPGIGELVWLVPPSLVTTGGPGVAAASRPAGSVKSRRRSRG
jgi:phosphohistidine phosphatase